jgi:hypothetical protein
MALVSADSIRIAIVPETVAGQTPANPVFQLVRSTGETFSFQPQTSENDELGSAGRSAMPADVVGMAVNGDINFRLAKAPWLDMAIAAVLAAEWGKCPIGAGSLPQANSLVVGNKLQTFTIEKRFPDPANPGGYLYHRYVGATFSAMSLTIAPNQPITGSFTIVGGEPKLDDAMISGATYVSAGNSSGFTAPKVVQLSIGSMFGVTSHCWNSLTINVNSQNRGVPCIGTTGDREVVLGTLTAELTGNVYFSSQDVLQALLDNRTIGDAVIKMADAETPPNHYVFQFFDVKPTAGSLNAGGRGQDLVIPLTLQPSPTIVCTNAGDTWESSVVVGKSNVTPFGTVTATVAGATTATPSVTMAGGPVPISGTVTLTVATNSVTTPVVITAAVAADDTADAVATKLVAAVTARAHPQLTATKGATGVFNLGVVGPSTAYTSVSVAVA